MRDLVAGRAELAPTGTKVLLGNENNISPDGLLRSRVNLTVVSVTDGGAFDPQLQVVDAQLPGWLVIVFDRAGSNDDIAAQLPRRVQVDVWVDRSSRRIVEIDVDRAAIELQPCREVAVHTWKREVGAFAAAYNVVEAPGAVWRGLRSLVKSWSGAVSTFAGPAPGEGPRPGWTPEEVEQMRRQAEILALRYQKHPAEREGMRRSSLDSLPAHAQQYAAGQLHRADMEALLMQAETATWVTPDEAAGFRRQAGLDV